MALQAASNFIRRASNVNSSYKTIIQASNVIQQRSYGAAPKPAHLAQYGGRYTVTMIPGDGIGPENMKHVKEIFRYSGVPIDFEEIELDSTHSTEEDFYNTIIAVKRNGVAIKGNIESPYGDPNMPISRNAALRTELDLFAYVLHCQSYPGVKTRHDDIDVVIIRQNTEGEYSMLEHESVSGVVESMKVVTRTASERLARYAFQFARDNGRKKLTTIHKANIMKQADGLFLQTFREISEEYPDIEWNEMIVDNTCMQLVSRPQQFDVMVMPNLYGTVISNLLCGLVGGPGLVSGRNYGNKYAVFEPGTRNTGTAMTGLNMANPAAMVNASCDLLDHLKLKQHAQLIRSSLHKTINVDKVHTADLGGQATSLDMLQSIIKNIQAQTAGSN